MSVLSDGVTTEGNPIESIRDALQTFQPNELLIVRSRQLRHHEDSLRRALAAHVSNTGRPIKTNWL